MAKDRNTHYFEIHSTISIYNLYLSFYYGLFRSPPFVKVNKADFTNVLRKRSAD